MGNLNRDAPATRLLADRGVFDQDPFVLLDVGCRGGIDPFWRIFGNSLVAHGFDPNVDECCRLQGAEQNPRVQYHAEFVGLPEGHEFLRRKAAEAPEPCPYWKSVLDRSSWALHDSHGAAMLDAFVARSMAGARPDDPVPTISLDDFISQQQLTNVDFIKTDTDGGDLEVLLSAERCFREMGVIGGFVECIYQGEDDETSNTFHNIDRLMKRHGLMIFSMTTFSYSRGALPAPYLYPEYAQTTFGQPGFGDIAFLRDPLWRRVGTPADLPLAKLLKLICLYEFFRVPDCAAEVIHAYRDRISIAIDPDRLLDLLTPSLGGRKVTYEEYVRAVAENPSGLLNNAEGFRDEALERSSCNELQGAVGPIIQLSAQSRIESGDPTRVMTSSLAWDYAAEFSLTFPAEISGKVHVRVRARVVSGVCSFGVLNRDGSAFQDRRFVNAGDKEQTIFLAVSDRSQAKSVVIEKASTDNQACEVLVFRVSAHADGRVI